jgi:hypothetical protein
MKNFFRSGLKTHLFVLMAAFLMASCSQKTAFVPKYNNLDYAQNYQKPTIEKPQELAVAEVVTPADQEIKANVNQKILKTHLLQNHIARLRKMLWPVWKKSKPKFQEQLKKQIIPLQGLHCLPAQRKARRNRLWTAT